MIGRNSSDVAYMGQSRRFRTAPEESGPPPITDIRCQRLTLYGLDLTVRRYRALRFKARSRPGNAFGIRAAISAMNGLSVGALGVSLFSEIVSCSAGHLCFRSI
jgi:hypothetical protein